MSDTDILELRAALIQLEKALETERACIIRIRKAIERNMQLPEISKAVTISPADSIAGYGTKEN